jgi:hypothetical protein
MGSRSRRLVSRREEEARIRNEGRRRWRGGSGAEEAAVSDLAGFGSVGFPSVI